MAKPKEVVPPFKEFAIGITMRAGTILMRNFNDKLKRKVTTKKNQYEIVTKSDLEVHKFVRFKIRTLFPTHNFLSEEGDPIDKGSEYTWVCDPLDGTLNYTIGNPFFSTSLTLMRNDVPIIGVIYAPFNREMFVAEKGGVSRLNERNIKVSQETKLEDSVISYSYFYRDKTSRAKAQKLHVSLEDKARAMRHLGCTTLELAYVANGRLEAEVISPPLRSWDVSAGMLMVEGAGGKITNLQGGEWKGLHQGIVCTNGKTHEQILDIIHRHKAHEKK